MLAAFIVVLIPLYIAGFGLYRWGMAQIQSQLIGDVVQESLYCLESIDAELARIRRQQTRFLQDRDVIRLAVLPTMLDEYERVSQINRVQSRLIAIQDSSAIIDDVFFHLPDAGYSLHADASYTPLATETYAELDALASSGPIVWCEDIPTLLLTYPQSGRSHSVYMIGVTLNADQLTRMIRRPGAESATLFLPSDGAMLAGFGSIDLSAIIANGTAAGQVLEQTEHWLIYEKSQQSGLALAGLVSKQRVEQPLQRYRSYFWLFTLGAAALAIGFISLVYRMVHRPLARLVEAFGAVQDGTFTVSIDHRHNDEFRYLYLGFNAMVARLKQLIDHVYQQRIYAQQMELKQLQSQINPHFLYNAFFALESMAQAEDMQSVSEFTRLLGDYFQYITRSAATQALLGEEVAHARNYALLQARRYRNRIRLSFGELPDDMARHSVPKLLLQPLLENAFEHGLKNKESGGLVSVWFAGEGTTLRMVVEDNGDDMSDEALAALTNALDDTEGECTGLCNVHRRLRLLFGPPSGVSLERSQLGGLRVVLNIERKERAALEPATDR